MNKHIVDQVSAVANKIKLLLIEDNPADRVLLREKLSCISGVDFHIAEEELFESGLKYLSLDTYLDLVILDFHLPDGNGVENIARIRKITPELPIIILTGMADDQLAMQLLQYGVQDFLTKGEVTSNSLLRSIRYAIERQQMVSRLEKSREIEQYLAYNDSLTGLANRERFYITLNNKIADAGMNEQKFALLFLDLNGFKRVNDTLGHTAGDQLLKIVATRLAGCARKTDSIFRLGGDEFTLILAEDCPTERLVGIANKILNEVSQPVVIGGQELSVGGSMGVSIYPDDGIDAESLVKNADIAMYHAKSKAGSSFAFYNSSLYEKQEDEFELENHLLKGIENGEFVLHYQPLMEMSSGKISSLEALIRWNHPKLGMIQPDRLIPIAEETGLIIPLSKWVLQTACKQGREWQEAGYSSVPIAVNLSAQQFYEDDFLESVVTILNENSLDPRFLGFELTESSAMQNLEYAIELLELFRQLGIKISMDDFGTGYSSLSYLNRLPIDTLKIDKSFINGIPEHKDRTTTTEAIVGLAHNLSLDVVAEGVENFEQLTFLNSLNCNRIQGYYISKPVDSKAAEHFLDRKNVEYNLS
ncbi:MAG: EAL domain-containing protein [Calditrichia bacterium]